MILNLKLNHGYFKFWIQFNPIDSFSVTLEKESQAKSIALWDMVPSAVCSGIYIQLQSLWVY